jgi:hypothetical protein
MGQAYFVLDKAACASAIKQEFARYDKERGVVAFILCPRNSRYYPQITTGANFWNRYSDKSITILFPGYTGRLNCPDEPFADQVDAKFLYDGFKELIDFFEDETNWRYRGGTELFMVMVGMREGEPYCDFDEVRVVDIDKRDDKKNFDFDTYIKNMINLTKQSPDNAIAKFDQGTLIDYVSELVMAAFPRPLKDMFGIVERYGQRNIQPSKQGAGI